MATGIHRTAHRYRHDTIDPVCADVATDDSYGDAETQAGARTAAEGARKCPRRRHDGNRGD